MKTEILLLFFCLLDLRTETATECNFKKHETDSVITEIKMDMFSALFLIEL